jgi:hypothetical protein
VTQPHINESGDVLCWNGEVRNGYLSEFNGAVLTASSTRCKDLRWAGCVYLPFYNRRTNQSSDSEVKVHPEENDGTKLFAAMSGLNDASDIVRLLGTLEGP